MNSLTLLLSHPENAVTPGGDIQGDVWLEIHKPTAGRTLKIRIDAYETCIMTDGTRFTQSLINDPSYTDVEEWQAHTTAFPFGSFRKAFSLRLPAGLPGSFHCVSLQESFQSISIEYKVTAYIAEEAYLTDSEVLRVCTHNDSPAREVGTRQSTSSDRMSTLFGKKKCRQSFEIKPKIASNLELTLELIIPVEVNIAYKYANHSLLKVFKVTHRYIKLVRTLHLQGDCVLTKSVATFSGRPPSNSYEKTLISHEFDCDSGMVSVPLNTIPAEYWTEASVDRGHSIRCQYDISLEVKDEDGNRYETPAQSIWIYTEQFAECEVKDKLPGVRMELFQQAMIIDESDNTHTSNC